jgi:hypothetical protein
MRNFVREYHTTLQLELKNHYNHYSTNVLQLHAPKCNFYVTTHYKYGELILKVHVRKIANCLIVAP